MYRGYILCNGKKAITKFKDVDELFTLEQVKESDSYAGVLDGETVMIDVDNNAEANALHEIVMAMGCKCDILKTTRGKHFYFRNEHVHSLSCKTGVNLLCGVSADIKTGRNAYDALKVDGIEREWILRYADDERDTIPKWLYPDGVYLFGKGEGDGRNDALFRLIPKLQRAGCSREVIKKLYLAINSFVFATPLSASELTVILRDDAFIDESKNVPKSKENKKKKKTYYDIGHELIEQHNITILPPFFLADGVIVSSDKMRQMAYENTPEMTVKGCAEVEEVVRLFAPKKEVPPATYICFSNGVFDVKENEWIDDTDRYGFINPIPHRYNELAYSEVVDKTLNKIACGDKDIRANIEEMIGYCLLGDCRFRKGFILYGGKRNGKSSLLRAMIKVFGEANVSAIDLKDLSKQFSTQILAGKLANIGDDISAEYIQDISVAKKLISGEYMTADRKFRESICFRNNAKLIFSANDLTRFKDDTGAMMDRLVIIPCMAEFKDTDADYNPMIEEDLTTEEALEYFVKLGVDALYRLLVKGQFTTGNKMEEIMRDYLITNVPVLDFFEMNPDGPNDGDDTQGFYDKYLAYCVKGNAIPMSKLGFNRATCGYFHVKTKLKKASGKVIRIYIAG